MSRQAVKSKKKRGISGKAKWIITLLCFALAVLTVVLCIKGGNFNFKPGSVQANDDVVVESVAPEEDEEEEEEVIQHKVFTASSKGGSVEPAGCTYVVDWDSLTVTFKADEGYRLKSVTVDGEDVGAVPAYTMTYIKEDHSILANFELIPEPSEEPDEDAEGLFDDD